MLVSLFSVFDYLSVLNIQFLHIVNKIHFYIDGYCKDLKEINWTIKLCSLFAHTVHLLLVYGVWFVAQCKELAAYHVIIAESVNLYTVYASENYKLMEGQEGKWCLNQCSRSYKLISYLRLVLLNVYWLWMDYILLMKMFVWFWKRWKFKKGLYRFVFRILAFVRPTCILLHVCCSTLGLCLNHCQ